MTTTCPTDHDICDMCGAVGGAHYLTCARLRPVKTLREEVAALEARVAHLEAAVLRFERAMQDDGH